MFIRLSLRKLGNHGDSSTIRFGTHTWLGINNEAIAEEAVHRMLKGSRVLLLAHGYNVKKSVGAYLQIERNVAKLYDVVIGLDWPGSEFKLGYWLAEQRSDKAGKIVAEIFRTTPRATLDVEGHSCGCRLVLEAVKQGLFANRLILAGAAVDNETVHYDGKYGPSCIGNVERGLICFSRQDSVLKGAFKMSSFFKNIVGLKVDDCKALGYSGAQEPALLPHNFIQVDLTDSIPDHSAYKETESFYKTWKEFVARQL